MPPVPPAGRRDCRCPRARHEHGTNAAYVGDLCRCADCRADHARVQLHRRRNIGYGRWAPHRHPCGTVRRLQALVALGWTYKALAPEIGIDPSTIGSVARGVTGQRISVSVAERVAVGYDRLSMTAYAGPGAGASRTRARRRGWLPPLAWDDETIDLPSFVDLTKRPAHVVDEIAVERATRGEPVRLTRAELSEARVSLERMGMSAREIAARLGVTPRTVQRARAQRRQDAAA